MGAAHRPRARAGGRRLHDAGHRLRRPARRHARAEGRRRPARRGARRRSCARTAASCAPAPTSSACCVSGGRASGVRLSGGETIAASRAVIAGVTPTQLYGRLAAPGARRRRRPGSRPRATATAARACRSTSRSTSCRSGRRPRPSGSRAPRWCTSRPGLDGVSRAVNEAERGLLPAEATIVVGQPCAVDPSRAPEGKSVIWIQLQELPRRPTGDALGEIDVGDGTWSETLREAYADRIVARLGAQITNLESATIKRVALSPADLEGLNCNLVGGDIYSGSCALDQNLLWRPTGQLPGPRDPARRPLAHRRLHAPGPGPRRRLRLPRRQAAAAAAARPPRARPRRRRRREAARAPRAVGRRAAAARSLIAQS